MPFAKVGRVADAVLRINFLYEEGTNGIYRPVVRNVVMEDVTVQQTPRVLRVEGFPGAIIEDIGIYNSAFRNVQKDDIVQGAEDVELVDCVVERASVDSN